MMRLHTYRYRPCDLEFLTAVSLKIAVNKFSVFWEMTPVSTMKVDRIFRGIYHLYVQGWRLNKASFGFSLCLFGSKTGGDTSFRNVSSILLHKRRCIREVITSNLCVLDCNTVKAGGIVALFRRYFCFQLHGRRYRQWLPPKRWYRRTD
jgi:hypothetical protein